MSTHRHTHLKRRLKKSFVGSLVFTVAVLLGFADYGPSDEYQDNTIIKTAQADTPHGGGHASGDGCGCGGGCGQGCGAGSGSSDCSGCM